MTKNLPVWRSLLFVPVRRVDKRAIVAG